MASPTLPKELWIHVLGGVSQKTLRAFMQVSRACYEAGLVHYLQRKLLNLAPRADTSEMRLDLVRGRLKKTKTNAATLNSVQVLRLTPHLYKQPVRESTQLQRARWRAKKGVDVPLPVLLASQAEKLTSRISALLPALTGVHCLEVFAEHLWWCFDMSPTLTIAWSEFSHRLTSVSFQVIDDRGLSRYLPQTRPFTLPALTTFRLHVSVGDFLDNYRTIHSLLQKSQLLEHLEYRLGGLVVKIKDSMSECSFVHPNLRTFKWTAAEYTRFPITFDPLFQLASLPLEVLYLNPAPNLALCQRIDFTSVVELRIDLRFCENPAPLFAGLAIGCVIRVLELTGYHSSFLRTQPLFILLCRMDSLTSLYMPIGIASLDFNALAIIAAKTPQLRKLVLTLITNSSLSRQIERVISESKRPANPKHAALVGWKLQDLGVFSDHVHINEFEELLNAIARVVPSVSSFYGSGCLRIPSEIHEDWGGDIGTVIPR
ncbi:hypothetical protein DL96DRAFT_845477 [Flagelloscypha sp. PMI_526]|nr:hypothetical protein DL96DRAFT_845477 [Flagelloscypha sp. PMI_526]